VSKNPPRRRRRQPEQIGNPEITVTPSRQEAAVVADAATSAPGRLSGNELDAAILRFLRAWPNGSVNLASLADELGIEPFDLQLTLERLARRRLLLVPFIEPSSAGGAELTEKGLRWLIRYEGGKPKDVPVAYRSASKPVRASDEAARLPRAEVYGTRN
jgi:hypothetical protein